MKHSHKVAINGGVIVGQKGHIRSTELTLSILGHGSLSGQELTLAGEILIVNESRYVCKVTRARVVCIRDEVKQLMRHFCRDYLKNGC